MNYNVISLSKFFSKVSIIDASYQDLKGVSLHKHLMYIV